MEPSWQRAWALLAGFLHSVLRALAPRQEALLPIPEGAPLLRELDNLYAAPLLAAVLLLLILGLRRGTVSKWMIALVAFVYVAPTVIIPIIPHPLMDDYSVSTGASQRLFSVFFGSLLLVWLLSGRLSRLRPARAAAATAAVLTVGGVLGTVTRLFNPVAAAAHVTFIIVFIESMVLTRLVCRRRYSARRFIAWLFIFNVATMLQVWPSLSWVALVGVHDIPPDAVLRQVMPMMLALALFDGVGLFIGLIPFLLVAFRASPHREHFRRILRLDTVATQS